MIARTLRRLLLVLRSLGRSLISAAPEILQGCAILSGWTLLTWGIAALTVWEVWPISGGLFFLSLAGWGHLKALFGTGLYTLSRPRPGREVRRG